MLLLGFILGSGFTVCIFLVLLHALPHPALFCGEKGQKEGQKETEEDEGAPRKLDDKKMQEGIANLLAFDGKARVKPYE